jgi:glycosyltransferase involved in cell wall biosynthesis
VRRRSPSLPPVIQARNCIAVIPCLNEAGAIRSLVREALSHVASVIVVDDGSTDATAAEAQAAGAAVLRHRSPLGKGRSLLDGWKAAAEAGYFWAITLDGDGQHAPSNIARFLARADEGTPLVVGNRMAAPEGMPWLRRQVNAWMSRRISALSGHVLPDSQCGFRLLHLPTLARVPLTADHFEIESEMLFQFLRHGHGVAFVPVDVIYAGERSSIRPLPDTLRWFRWWRAARKIANGASAPVLARAEQHPGAVFEPDPAVRQ